MPNCYVVILGHCVRVSRLTSNAISEAKRKSKATFFIATCLFNFFKFDRRKLQCAADILNCFLTLHVGL